MVSNRIPFSRKNRDPDPISRNWIRKTLLRSRALSKSVFRSALRKRIKIRIGSQETGSGSCIIENHPPKQNPDSDPISEKNELQINI